MINKKIKKIILLITLITFFSFYNTDLIYADYSANYGYTDDNDGNGSGKCSGPANCPANVTACCSISKGYDIWSEIYVDAYDMNGQKIDTGMSINQDILAGTYVGLDVYEKKGYSSWASYKVSAIQTYYKCTHKETYWDCTNTERLNNTCRKRYKYTYYERIFGCDAGDSSSKQTRPYTPCASQVAACKARATPISIDLKPSYNVSYRDSNDIDGNTTGEYNTEEVVTGGECTKTPKETSRGNKRTKSNECIFYYNREAACINVMNGKVRYIKENEECSEEEYKITSEDDYWKYFVPLNANSADDFSFIMYSSGDKQHAGICADLINKYPNYAELITDSNGIAFTGNESKIYALSRVQNGCYYQTTVTIPVEQKFYNELENGKNFEGFNFYYKPIDINNPFPNGLTNTSIWYEWNNDPNQDLDLTDSYNEITYIASVADNTSDIREYANDCGEKNCQYTSWYNMNINGTSNFIQDKDYIIRNVQKNSYYPLGCGPWNENQYNEDGTKNIFYQPECDN